MHAAFYNPQPLPFLAMSRAPHGGYYYLPGLRGDDDDSSFGQNAGKGIIGGATIGVQTAVSTGSAVAGGVAGALALIAPFTGPAAPFIMAAAAIVGPIAMLFKGCGQTCVLATQYANQAADAVNAVQNQYFAQPVRTRASQIAALGLINDLMAQLQKACGNPSLGPAGQRCISERIVRGGTAPWCPTPDHKGCDWFAAHIDPIANDPGVVPDPVQGAADAVNSAVNSVSSIFSGSYAPLLIGLGAIALFIAFASGSDK